MFYAIVSNNHTLKLCTTKHPHPPLMIPLRVQLCFDYQALYNDMKKACCTLLTSDVEQFNHQRIE